MIKRKSFLGFMIACCLIVSSLFVLTACGDKEQHQHKFSTAWSSDETYHWHEAECEDTDEVKDKGFHKNSGWEKNDTQHWKDCDVCGRELIGKTNHNFVDLVCECGQVSSDAVVGYTSADGTTVYSISLTKSDIEGLEAGSTVTLLKDATIDSYIPLNKSVTIDFGGHKLTASQSGGFDIREDATVADEVRVVLKNGTLDTYKWGAWIENGGKLTVENNLNIIANRAELKTAPGITIVDPGSQLDLFGKVKAFGETNVISGNGTAGQGNVVINIHDGAVVEGFDNGIYMPNSGTLTINAATITAKTAVYLRSGDTTINGATLNATGAKVEYSFVSGQQPATGDAVVVNAVGADKYPGGNPTLNIVKGTTINVKTENCAAIAVYNVFGNAANVNNTTQYEVVTNEI